MTPEERALALRGANWQQGSVCRNVDVPLLLATPAHPQLACREDDWLVVVTQTCDLLQGDLVKEPQAELLRLSPSRPSINTSLGWGQHPRFIQLERSASGLILYGSVHDRVWIPKSRLDAIRPDTTRAISEEDTRMLAKWLASRYLRPAFPDAFNLRLQPVEKALGKFLRTQRKRLRAVYCTLSSMDELPDEDSYEAEFVLVYPYQDLTQAEGTELADSFEDIFTSCPGVEVSAKGIRDSDFSMVHMLKYMKWDLDYLSFSDPIQSPLPPIDVDCG